MAATSKQAFVLIGIQGSGKSATGNSIIGTTCFKSKPGTVPLTREIKEELWQWQKRDITIIHTPPVNGLPEFTKIKNHARTKYTNITYGFVISIGRLLAIETVLLEKLCKELDPKKEDLVLIFTRYDDLDSYKSLKSWLSNCPMLEAFLEKQKVKCFYFANKNGNKPIKDHVNDLMSTIMGITKEVKHDESQAHVNLSANVDTTDKVKHAETQSSVQSKTERSDEIPVSCQILKEYFGRYGSEFYNEVLKKGTK